MKPELNQNLGPAVTGRDTPSLIPLPCPLRVGTAKIKPANPTRPAVPPLASRSIGDVAGGWSMGATEHGFLPTQ